MNLNALRKKYVMLHEQFDDGHQGEMSAERPKPVEAQVALSWKELGLYEPETEEEAKLVEIAAKDIEKVFTTIEFELKDWQERYKKIGAGDTISKETVAQFIAANILGVNDTHP